MSLLLQRIFDGVFNSGIYASLAVALTLIYRSTGMLNFAQGEMATFSAYIALILLSPSASPILKGSGLFHDLIPGLPWPVPLAIVGAIVFGFVVAAVVQRIFIQPLEGKPELATVNITIGLLLVVNGLMVEFWLDQFRLFPSPFPTGIDDQFHIVGARLRYESIGVWLTLVAALFVVVVILKRTKTGLAFRALSSNRNAAELVGIDVNKTVRLGWATAAAFGALAATLVANPVFLQPTMMLRVLIFSFAAATLGGLDSPGGALVGGLVVGLTQTMAPPYVPFITNEISLLPVLVVMLLVLLVRPWGLFGTKRLEVI